jgi:arsenite methyltransferase
MKNQKPNFGQELIPVLRIMAAIIIILVSGMIYMLTNGIGSNAIIIVMGSFVIFFGALITMSIWSSRIGKLIMRDRMIEELKLSGNENVLDIGCGKGLLTVGIAKKLNSGRVVGLDHWKGTFEYNYTREMAENNVAIEGVSNKVEIVNGDAKKLPFETGKFDIITSSLAMHHVGDGNQAFREMQRVLKPSGTIAIADMPTAKIKKQMQEEGFEIILIKPLVRLFFVKVYLILAKKKQ